MRIAINGFGRIGRLAFRTLSKRHPEIEIVAVNDLTDAATNAHLLKYDSNYGIFNGDISVDGDTIQVNGKNVQVLSQREWKELPWDNLGIDVALECTGIGTSRALASRHIDAGAKKVLISAPSSDADAMIVLGVNEETYNPSQHSVISNASCTTNGLAPPVSVVHAEFGIIKGQMTTVHSYTSTQAILDTQKSDLRDARAGALNTVPAATGAARAIGKVIPDLNGKLDGMAYRVPTPTVSIVEFVVLLETSTTTDAVNTILEDAAEGPLKGIMDYSEEPLVSTDLKGNEHSSIVDAGSTMVVADTLLKVAAWYDNEWGYASRLADMTAYLGERLAQ